MMAQGPSVVALLVLAAIGVVILGGLLALVALLTNPRTRAAAGALLAIVLLVLAIGGAGLLALKFGRRVEDGRARAVARLERIGSEMREKHASETAAEPGIPVIASGKKTGSSWPAAPPT